MAAKSTRQILSSGSHRPCTAFNLSRRFLSENGTITATISSSRYRRGGLQGFSSTMISTVFILTCRISSYRYRTHKSLSPYCSTSRLVPFCPGFRCVYVSVSFNTKRDPALIAELLPDFDSSLARNYIIYISRQSIKISH
jgi:hypothetical protein